MNEFVVYLYRGSARTEPSILMSRYGLKGWIGIMGLTMRFVKPGLWEIHTNDGYRWDIEKL